ncbi:MAG: NADPH-dependent glutamate synthase [Clostridiales bacterium]|nr:NADPH-dependent glutamate synthase [Clostridiales bacterium]
MPNLSLTKTPIPKQPVEERIHNFDEVELGYTEELALEEASRCLNCKHPQCVQGCPVNNMIPDFIAQIRENNLDEAYRIISINSGLPAVCGRVCPQERQCESRCVRGIKGEPVAIGRLERYVADRHYSKLNAKPEIAPPNGHKVAVVGSGPAGLTCAGELAKIGYKVTIFEALHVAGGVLVYGIPEFCLPNYVVQREVDNVTSLGVEILTNMVIGKTLTVSDLFERGYEAVYLANGAAWPTFMGIPGENLNGVYSANEYLIRINLMHAYRKEPDTPIMKGGTVAVVGGGNVAIDAARAAVRLGAEKVSIIYRRSEEEIPARREEVKHAREEGIELMMLTNPVELIGYDKDDPKYGFVKSVRCIRMELGEPDERGRRTPIPIPGTEFTMDVDTVIMAIGTVNNPLIKKTTAKLEVNGKGGIVADRITCKTSREGVFAGGDVVTGPATVIAAMGSGRLAARSIDKYVKAKAEGNAEW